MYVIRLMYMQEVKQEMYTKRVTKNYERRKGEEMKENTFGLSKVSCYVGLGL